VQAIVNLVVKLQTVNLGNEVTALKTEEQNFTVLVYLLELFEMFLIQRGADRQAVDLSLVFN
jgi:hypothetical protein